MSPSLRQVKTVSVSRIVSQPAFFADEMCRNKAKPRVTIKLFLVLIDLIIELLDLIIKTFDNQTES